MIRRCAQSTVKADRQSDQKTRNQNLIDFARRVQTPRLSGRDVQTRVDGRQADYLAIE